MPNLVTPALIASEPEGIRLKTETCPEGTILTPRGRHLHGTCITPGCIYSESCVSLRCSRSKIWSFLFGFAKGSRGGTCHVPRATWRHETNAIVVPALLRIFWCLSRPDPTIRSGAINRNA